MGIGVGLPEAWSTMSMHQQLGVTGQRHGSQGWVTGEFSTELQKVDLCWGNFPVHLGEPWWVLVKSRWWQVKHFELV